MKIEKPVETEESRLGVCAKVAPKKSYTGNERRTGCYGWQHLSRCGNATLSKNIKLLYCENMKLLNPQIRIVE